MLDVASANWELRIRNDTRSNRLLVWLESEIRNAHRSKTITNFGFATLAVREQFQCLFEMLKSDFVGGHQACIATQYNLVSRRVGVW